MFTKGDRHEGMYVDDKRNGWGKYMWANGDKFIGHWINGMMHGRGTFTWAKVHARRALGALSNARIAVGVLRPALFLAPNTISAQPQGDAYKGK